jgi:hypothetical protein
LARYLLSKILLVIAQLGGLINAKGWKPIAIHVIVILWFKYCLAGKVPDEGSG